MNIYSRCSKVALHNEKFNALEVNYNQEVYAFDVRTRASVAGNMCGTLKRTIRAENFLPIVSSVVCNNLPSSKNWLDEGKVTPVQDQEQCNSDYIFAPAASIESHAAIKEFAAPVKLSEQHLIECIRDPASTRGGCNKGKVEWIWNDANSEGGEVASAAYNPWTGIDSGPCQKGLPKAPRTRVASWVKLPVANEETLKCHLANVGPIVCSMDFSEVIMSYKSGIYDDPRAHCNSSIELVGKYYEMAMPYNHALLVVRRTGQDI